MNDRGPFVDGRIIDVSKRAAELLGFRRKGIAKVRVELLAEETIDLWRSMGMVAEASPEATELPASEPSLVRPAAVETAAIEAPRAPAGEPAYIQAGAFASYPNAVSARSRLSGIGRVQISTVNSGVRDLYRVRVGPVPAGSEAQELLVAVVRAGYPQSRIVTD